MSEEKAERGAAHVDTSPEVEGGWVSRYRQRSRDRHALRADRRARRRARFGGTPDDAARRAESGNYQSGGFFTKKP
jgi:hypothetical protein